VTFGSHRCLALAGADVADYCGDRERFFGSYRNYGNPKAVEKGAAGGAHAYNGNAVGVLQSKFILEPGETKTFCYVIGEGNFDAAAEWVTGYANPAKADAELQELINYWHGKLNNLVVNTPDDAFNHEVNTWNAYQCFITFTWSRAASFVYCGQRNGYGYRDTVQDIQGIIHLDHTMAKQLLIFMLSAQVSNGAGMPLVKYNHHAGPEDTADSAHYRATARSHDFRSDDALWLFPTVDKYIRESGDLDFLDEVIPFIEKGGEAGTVLEHLKRAIEFSYDNMTEFGLPAGLSADWNDCLHTGKHGVSSFVTFQLYYALTIFEGYAKFKNNTEWHDWALDKREKLSEAIDKYLVEPDRYLRSITEKGEKIGSAENEEGSVWLNAQSWGVISGKAQGDYAQAILGTVNKNLNTKYGVKLLAPPFVKIGFPLAVMVLFNPGTKENAGIFSHTQGWIIQAESKAGNGNRAFEYYTKANPCAYNDIAEIRMLEPYAHGQFIESDYSPYHGRANVPWLTGPASTMMIAAVEGILGIHPQYDGIEFDPCIPSDWKGLTIDKMFRGKKLRVEVINETGAEKGVKRVVLNGAALDGVVIPFDKLECDNEVKLYM
jgi:cellobiose phosphorylase